MNESSILSMLHGRARLRPDDVAFVYTEYADDPAGVAESVTWSQLSRRTLNAAREFRNHGTVGDRAMILAPQGMEYIVSFLGAMQAGLIAVPLPLPNRGSSLDRVAAVFDDTDPAIVLTTSAVLDDVGDYVDQSRMAIAPKIVEVDSLTLDVDVAAGVDFSATEYPSTAYLQYSSGSTRRPTGVMVSHRNLQVNFEQLMGALFGRRLADQMEATIVSWLPFYHDMGLVLGICAPILGGFRGVLSSPVSFLENPARWVRELAQYPRAFSGAPNFAFGLAARKTSDRDLDGLDLGGVLGIINGAERVEPATLERFADRFAHFNFREDMLRPCYGLAEATVFVTAGTWGESAAVEFDPDELSAGRVVRCASGAGTALVTYKIPSSPVVRIVDVDSNRECPPDVVGEIWVHGDNVAAGYWSRPPEDQQCFGATLADPSPGTPEGPWLRTGDLGFILDGELFIVGRIKDMLIIRGRNYYPEDIEATVQEITRGRVAAVSVPVKNSTEKLVTVVELKKRTDVDDPMSWLGQIKSEVTSAISNAHGLNVEDLVLVQPGSIPTTTSGKIRRVATAEHYRQHEFVRLDA
ncbi:AMP-binding protein [Mycolicibacterium vanbaalenii]|nr:AMP-binding protein [Mycolicibacterium vanbaalenii]